MWLVKQEFLNSYKRWWSAKYVLLVEVAKPSVYRTPDWRSGRSMLRADWSEMSPRQLCGCAEGI